MFVKNFRLADQETTSLDPLVRMLYPIINVNIEVKILSYRIQVSFSECVPAILNSPLKFGNKLIITYK